MEAAIDFANSYPFLWIVYPLALVIPIACVVTLLLRLSSSDGKRKQPHSGESTVVTSSNNNSRGSKKSVKSEHYSDGTPSSSPKKRSRYIIRGRSSDGDDKPEHNQDVSEEEVQKWSFPPTLEEFNLMDLDIDPSVIEDLFTDERLIQVVVRLSPSQGLGLAIVGGCDSANGEAPIYIKRILPDSVLQRDGKLKAGDQLIAVNDVLLVNAAKEHASEILSNVGGVVRLLAIQDL